MVHVVESEGITSQPTQLGCTGNDTPYVILSAHAVLTKGEHPPPEIAAADNVTIETTTTQSCNLVFPRGGREMGTV